MAYFRHFFSVDPAYAGMILALTVAALFGRGGPRVCGADPGYAEKKSYPAEWTPRMRG